MVKHIVVMKFKWGVSESDVVELQEGLRALPAAIPEIKSYEFGVDVIHTERSYDFALVSAFENLEAMKKYQVHPAHMVILKKVAGMCESIVAVDFEY